VVEEKKAPRVVGVGGLGLMASRIISDLQGCCAHEKAAEEAAEQENLISTNDEIV